MVGGLLSNFLWGYISDYVSNRRVIQISLITSIFTPIVALLIVNSHWPSLFILVFVLAGFCVNGGRVGNTNYLLEIAPSRNRPTYIGLSNTLVAPTALFPLIGGVIIQYASFVTLFVLTALLISIGFLLSLKLQESRKYNIRSQL